MAKTNQDDHLERVKLSCTMADIIDLITSKLEFFYNTILSRMLRQNLFKIKKTIWLKIKSLSF